MKSADTKKDLKGNWTLDLKNLKVTRQLLSHMAKHCMLIQYTIIAPVSPKTENFERPLEIVVEPQEQILFLDPNAFLRHPDVLCYYIR